MIDAFIALRKRSHLPGIADLFLLSPSRIASTIADIIVRTVEKKIRDDLTPCSLHICI